MIKSGIAAILGVVLISSSFSQNDLIMTSFVKKEVVLLRWAPKSSENFKKGLELGYTIVRAPGGISTSQNVLDHPERKLHRIPPGLIKLEELRNAKDKTTKQMAVFLDEFLNSNPEKIVEAQLFATLLMAAGPNQKLAGIINSFWSDSTIVPGETYTYLIGATSLSDQNKFIVGPELLTVVTSEQNNNAPMTKLSFDRPKTTTVNLTWDTDAIVRSYSGYNILRSNDDKSYMILNKEPFIHLKNTSIQEKVEARYLDSTKKEGATFYYKIQGINHFGEPGQESNVVEVSTPELLVGTPVIDTAYFNQDHHYLKVSFRTTKENQNNIIQKTVLQSAMNIKGPWKQVLESPEANTEFRVENLTHKARFHYRAVVVSTYGDTLFSYPYYVFGRDNVPPVAPVGLSATIDTAGVVLFSWQPNSETDIQGYKVYRSNSLREEFVELSKEFVTDTLFTDTVALNNLTKEMYYCLKAVDENFNHSGFSEPVEVIKPDTIPPTPAGIRVHSFTEEFVRIAWSNSSSSDVDNNRLFRTSGDNMKLLLTWSDTTSSLSDSSAQLGLTNEYLIQTTDQAGNVTRSKPYRVNYETGSRPALRIDTVQIDRESKLIRLAWDETQYIHDVFAVKVYRKKNDGPMTLIHTARKKIGAFVDKNLSMNNAYSYQLKVTYSSGISSELSEPVTLSY
jgi:uncharacterized protein